MRIRIAHRNKLNGEIEHGKPFDIAHIEALNSWVQGMNEKYPYLEHWVESEPPEGWSEETAPMST